MSLPDDGCEGAEGRAVRAADGASVLAARRPPGTRRQRARVGGGAVTADRGHASRAAAQRHIRGEEGRHRPITTHLASTLASEPIRGEY